MTADRFWTSADSTSPADLKLEFERLINGHGSFEGVGQIHVFRSLTKEFCVCWDAVQGSSSDCKFCLGESYVWTEAYHRAYFTQTFGRSITGTRQSHILEPMGYLDEGKANVYAMASAAPKVGDSIFRVRLNDAGSLYYPIERIEKWRITGVENKRYDRGKLAYYICLCEREEA